MKKSLIALASVAALGAAHADVTLYGVIDAGFATASAGLSSDANNPGNMNVLPSSTGQTATTGRVTSMVNGMLQPSRWGLKGSEDLGQGLKANFVLESGLNIAAGVNPNDHALLSSANTTLINGAGDSSLNGQMFDRQASVGVSGNFGSVDVGFQLNLAGEMNGAMDPLGAGYISPLGFYGGLTGMNSSYTGRASNSIKYATSMGSTTIKGFYAMGGASGNAGAGSQLGLSVMLDATPDLSIGIVSQRMNDNVAYASGGAYVLATGTSTIQTAYGVQYIPTNALTATYYNSTQSQLMAKYQATPTLKLFGGYLTETMSNPSNASVDSAITQNLGVPISGTAYLGTNTNPYASNYTITLGYAGFNYQMSPTDKIMLGYYIRTLGSYSSNTALALSSSNSTVTNYTQLYAQNRQNIVGAAWDHDLSKKTDIYVAMTWTNYDAQGSTTAVVSSTVSSASTTALSQWKGVAGQSISFIGAGLRVKF
jgi:predicted porin